MQTPIMRHSMSFNTAGALYHFGPFDEMACESGGYPYHAGANEWLWAFESILQEGDGIVQITEQMQECMAVLWETHEHWADWVVHQCHEAWTAEATSEVDHDLRVLRCSLEMAK